LWRRAAESRRRGLELPQGSRRGSRRGRRQQRATPLGRLTVAGCRQLFFHQWAAQASRGPVRAAAERMRGMPRGRGHCQRATPGPADRERTGGERVEVVGPRVRSGTGGKQILVELRRPRARAVVANSPRSQFGCLRRADASCGACLPLRTRVLSPRSRDVSLSLSHSCSSSLRPDAVCRRCRTPSVF